MSADPTRGAAPWWIGPLAAVLAAALVVLARTWRIEWVDLAPVEARIASGRQPVFAFWHARMLPLVFTHRARGAAVLISRHHDGELVARVIERFGFVAARGSSTRGGGAGARAMLRFAAEGRLLAVTPDGPRGPAERVKPGVVVLASASGREVVPVASASSRTWVLRSWDRFRVPQPFARVVVGYGAPIAMPVPPSGEALESARGEVEAAVSALTRALDARAERRS